MRTPPAAALALYRMLLRLYPASFRHEYRGEMSAVFTRRWRQTPSALGRAGLLVGALVDAVCNAPLLHADILRQDAAVAVRSFRRTPLFGVTVVLVAALGIGATTTAFSLADHVLLRPLPFPNAGRLVKVWQAPPGGGRLEPSPAHARDWQRARSFAALAAFDGDFTNLVGRGQPAQLEGAQVGGDLFPLLGVPPLLGRTLGPADDRPESPGAIVLSEKAWRRRFGADPGVIGAAVTLNDAAYTIVGVMPERFEFPARGTEYWRAYRFRADEVVYNNPSLEVVARLKPGVSRAQAQDEVRQIVRDVAQATGLNPRTSAMVIDLRGELMPQSRLLLWCLLGAAAGVLLIACTNLANLLLTRSLARQRELAMRAALGAGRHRLVRQMLTESGLLAGLGGAAGIALAAAGLPLAARLVPTNLPIAETPSLDGRVLVAATLVTLASAVAFGVLPAWRTARHADGGALRAGARGGISRKTERLRSLLVVAQVAASVVLLVASGLLLRAMLQVQAVDPGFRTGDVIALETPVRDVPKYAAVDERNRFYTRVLAEVRALPGVSQAAFVSGLPMVVRGMIWRVRVPGQPDAPEAQRNASMRFVTTGFFATLGVPVLEGRDVSDADTAATQPVAVVSESFVRRYWPGQSGLGRAFTLRNVDRTIVGVVGNVRVRGLERDSEPQMYMPSRQVEDGVLSGYVPRELVVRTSLPQDALLAPLRDIIGRADPQLPVGGIRVVSDIIEEETAPRRVQVRILGVFAAVAFLLAGVGLHGLLAYSVSQRVREFGVRVALGQERASILAMVLRHGFRLALLGVVVGSGAAVAVGRLLRTLLFGVSPTDAATFGAAIGLALLMTLAGSLLPAIRAVRVSPIEVMRAE